MTRTVVSREPEWTAHEVAKMQALVEYEAGICACGLHQAVADTDPDLDMPARVCPVCTGLQRNWRVIKHADDAAIKALGKAVEDPHTPLPSDGRHFSLVTRSVASQVPSDETQADPAGNAHRDAEKVRH